MQTTVRRVRVGRKGANGNAPPVLDGRGGRGSGGVAKGPPRQSGWALLSFGYSASRSSRAARRCWIPPHSRQVMGPVVARYLVAVLRDPEPQSGKGIGL